MKKLLIVAALGLIVSGCEKKYCWVCTTVASGGGSGSTDATYCDETEANIKSREGMSTATDTVGGKQIQVVYETTCKKQ